MDVAQTEDRHDSVIDQKQDLTFSDNQKSHFFDSKLYSSSQCFDGIHSNLCFVSLCCNENRIHLLRALNTNEQCDRNGLGK